MKLFKTWCWAKSRMGRAVLTLVSNFLSSFVLKVNNIMLLEVRLFSVGRISFKKKCQPIFGSVFVSTDS